MKTWVMVVAIFVAAYLACGLYVVRGNEQAVVRRFGKARPGLVGSGLHFDLPWPWTRISRVNLNEGKTISIATPTTEFPDDRGSNFLKPALSDRQSEFLTGDKNLLHVQVNVQYRVSDPYQYLFAGESPDRQLRCLAEALVTGVVARSGVDFVHPLGLNELRRILTARARRLPEEHGLGLVVEDVTINDVRPPVLVKQAFLDVSNARAERERMINESQAQAERLVAQSQAEAQREIDRAETERHKFVTEAQGAADRFSSLVGQFERDAAEGKQSYREVRQIALRRMYLTAMEEILPKLAGKIFVDGDQPVDLTIERSPRD